MFIGHLHIPDAPEDPVAPSNTSLRPDVRQVLWAYGRKNVHHPFPPSLSPRPTATLPMARSRNVCLSLARSPFPCGLWAVREGGRPLYLHFVWSETHTVKGNGMREWERGYMCWTVPTLFRPPPTVCEEGTRRGKRIKE